VLSSRGLNVCNEAIILFVLPPALALECNLVNRIPR
jgi:hypothetical protein